MNRSHLRYELDLQKRGYLLVAGVDEAGRGAWAGPVVAAAVVFADPQRVPAELIAAVDDSKKLTDRGRRMAARLICSAALRWATGIVEAPRIDQIGIVGATVEAMKAALEQTRDWQHVLVDAVSLRPYYPCTALIRGDQLSFSIAAASIIAKVTRDDIMIAAAKKYPQYAFDRHVGYGTLAHHRALIKHGSCPLHRRTYQPVAKIEKQGILSM